MPQASDEQRAVWGISEDKAMAYLYFHGWTLIRGWQWWHPLLDTQNIPGTDIEAICFLVDEWDFGYCANRYTEPMGSVDYHIKPQE